VVDSDMSMSGELFVLSAPSGTGKTTLIQSMLQGGLCDVGELVFAVSHTTRTPRVGEVDGEDYHFVDRPTFHEMIEGDDFLEWEEVHDNDYGTSWREVRPRLEEGTDVLMDIDVKGAERVLKSFPEATGIFIMPPSFATLQNRLEGRGLDDPQDVAGRLSISHWEIKRYELYDFVIINDDAQRASDVLASIILSRRHRSARMNHQVEAILRDFQSAFERASRDVARE